MCVGVPMQVLDVAGMRARCRGAAGEVEIDTLLVGALQPGDWVLTHLGAAREVIDATRALQVQDALDALNAVMQGGAGDARAAIDLAFADLINRPPTLPAHLQMAAPAGAAAGTLDPKGDA